MDAEYLTYATEWAAEDEAEYVNRRRSDGNSTRYHAWFCDHCDGWHFGYPHATWNRAITSPQTAGR